MAKKYPVQYQYNVSSATHKKRGGCASIIIWVFVAMFAVVILGNIVGGSSGTSSPNTPSTTRRATSTPRITKAPTPTPTEEPHYDRMPIDQAAESLANRFAGSSFTLDYVLEVDGGVLIEMTLLPYLTEKTAVRDCCRFSLQVGELLFGHPGVKSLAIYYNTAGRDAYGNETVVRAMDIMLDRATAEKINFAYFVNHLYTSTKDYLDIVTRYYVHRDLSGGVYD